MTEDEQRAYWQALLGSGEEPTDERGCAGLARNETYYEIVYERRDVLDEATARLVSDPRYVEIEDEWSRCMAREGYDIRDRMTGIGEYFGEQMETARNAGEDNTEALAQLRQEEIAVATVDLECLAPFEERLRTLSKEYEEAIATEISSLLVRIAELEAQQDG